MNQTKLTDFATRYAAAWSSQNPVGCAWRRERDSLDPIRIWEVNVRALSMIVLLTCTVARLAIVDATQAVAPYTLEQVMGYSFPADLIASAKGERIAWTTVHRGVRNIWMARAPDFRPRMLTSAREEDGQELTNLAFSEDGRHLVWTRGGVHGANWEAEGNLMPNPTSSAVQQKL